MTIHAIRAKAIINQCYQEADSTGRLGLALDLLAHETSGAVFWPVLCDVWCSTDNTWNHRHELHFMMIVFARTRRRYVPAEKQVPDHWPNFVNVWRGCSRERVKGHSWTLDKEVARGFARGHRGIRVPDPVVASAEIPKSAIFFIEDERKEKEVVLDPTRLRNVIVHNFSLELAVP